MMDMDHLGRKFWRARFLLENAREGLFFDERIPDDEADEHFADLDAAIAEVKAISDAVAHQSDAFCRGYIAANKEALAAGERWSKERAEKIALLRLSGDDTPEEQIS